MLQNFCPTAMPVAYRQPNAEGRQENRPEETAQPDDATTLSTTNANRSIFHLSYQNGSFPKNCKVFKSQSFIPFHVK